MMGQIGRPRRIVLFAPPEVQLLDLAGPLDVFDAARRYMAYIGNTTPTYRSEVAASQAGPIATTCGLSVTARGISAVRGPVDTLIVAGSANRPDLAIDDRALASLRRIADRARRVASVCSGAFVLARAGILSERRATTHWFCADELARAYPDVEVESDAIYIRDGNVYTSAGVTAGIDLSLALVEEDMGRDMALMVARLLVVFLKRPGGQSQFSAPLAAQQAARQPLTELIAWVAAHPHEDLRVPELARRAGMSPRNFARRFAEETGHTPARFVRRARVEAARHRLEETRESIDEIAAECGFGSAEMMRRAFQDTIQVSPAAYRNRFRHSEI
ncbi:MAG: GlxA family transcriptional regulator [Proteobacteria bacterium]|nr:GlxA family transcriptional regulator [Pseudomonadota bacterium]